MTRYIFNNKIDNMKFNFFKKSKKTVRQRHVADIPLDELPLWNRNIGWFDFTPYWMFDKNYADEEVYIKSN